MHLINYSTTVWYLPKHPLKADYQHFLSCLFILDNVKCSFIFKCIIEVKLYHCCATNCYLCFIF